MCNVLCKISLPTMHYITPQCTIFPTMHYLCHRRIHTAVMSLHHATRTIIKGWFSDKTMTNFPLFFRILWQVFFPCPLHPMRSTCWLVKLSSLLFIGPIREGARKTICSESFGCMQHFQNFYLTISTNQNLVMKNTIFLGV